MQEKRKWSAYRILKTAAFVAAFVSICWFVITFKNGSENIDKNSYANNLVYIVVVMVIGILVYAITTKLREKND